MAEKEDKQSNVFSEMKAMMMASIGRIPASLVIVTVIAIVAALLSGAFLEFNKPDKAANEFLHLSLDVENETPTIDAKKIQGGWVYQTTDYAMSLTFVGDRFEWIIVVPDIPGAQFYARGNYRIVGDVMIFGIRTDLGKPYDPQKPWLKYIPIAMKGINTKVLLDGGRLVWDVPRSEQKKILSHASIIFDGAEGGKFSWKKR